MLAGVEISEASLADAEELSALAIRTYVDAFGAEFEPDELAYHLHRTISVARWREYLTLDRVLMARANGHALGFVQIGPGKRGMDIHRLYVDRAAQGGGIGSELLRQALAMPEVAAAAAVYIDVWEHNPSARRLYERFGFRHEGELEPFINRAGEVDGHDLVLVRRNAPGLIPAQP